MAQPLVFAGWVSSGSPANLNSSIRSAPKGFPVRDLQLPVQFYRPFEKSDYGIFSNVGSFYAKRPLYNRSFTSPTTLTSYYHFVEDSALLRSLENASTVNFGDGLIRDSTLLAYSNKTAASKIEIKEFSPGSLRTRVTTDSSGILWIFQNNYPGWKAEADGRSQMIETVNHSFMGIKLTPGSHEVHFYYSPAWLRPAFAGSIAGLLLSLLCIIRPLPRKPGLISSGTSFHNLP